MPPEGVAFLFTLTIIGSTVLLFPLVRALAERIRSKNVDAGVREELQLLREDLLGEIQQARREIGELGERRSEEHTSELQSLAYLVCRLLLEKKNIKSLAMT